jgi:hypothetical protein
VDMYCRLGGSSTIKWHMLLGECGVGYDPGTAATHSRAVLQSSWYLSTV